MKKSIIAAGAASAVLAAMPVVGVFAAETQTHTDTINIKLAQVCTLGTVNAGVAVDGNDATTHAGVEDVSSWTGDTLTANMAAGTTQESIGTTTFTIRCNDAAGYSLKAVSGSAEEVNETATSYLASGNNRIYTGTGASFIAASSASYWNFKLGSATTGLTIANGYNAASIIPATTATVVATGVDGNLNDGQSVTVTYGAGINNTQPAGTYTGTVVYTLVPNTTN